MTRPLRIEMPGGWYHITARGNEQKAIFRDDRDRRRFLELAEEGVERFALRLHAYVLMGNHYHLLLELSQANLSQAMHWIGVSYTGWFNRRHGRVGHLFQGRFTGILVEWASVWEVSRYVHLNPVRTERMGLGKAAQREERSGVGERPSPELVKERLQRLTEYPWSSYRAYIGVRPCPRWLTTKTVLAMGGRGTAVEQARVYRRYVEEAVRAGQAESPWDRLQAQVVLGSASFVARIRSKLRGDEREQPSFKVLQKRPSWEEVVCAVEAVKGESWPMFRDRHGDWGRDMALCVARRQCGMRLKELAEVVGELDYGSVAVALLRFRKKLAKRPDLCEMYDEIARQLYK